jgi:MtN3 and saliva related transmembrane protein
VTPTDIVGYLATAVGTLLMVPQVLKGLRTKSMEDVSGVMIGAYLLNCALWGTYGYLLASVPLMLCNGIAFCIGLAQAHLKIRYRRAAASVING